MKRLSRDDLQTLRVQAHRESSDEFAKSILPVVLPGAAGEVAGAVVDVGLDFVESAGSAHRDGQDEIAQAFAEADTASKQRGDLPALCRL
jgi:hypothetical protein